MIPDKQGLEEGAIVLIWGVESGFPRFHNLYNPFLKGLCFLFFVFTLFHLVAAEKNIVQYTWSMAASSQAWPHWLLTPSSIALYWGYVCVLFVCNFYWLVNLTVQKNLRTKMKMVSKPVAARLNSRFVQSEPGCEPRYLGNIVCHFWHYHHHHHHHLLASITTIANTIITATSITRLTKT